MILHNVAVFIYALAVRAFPPAHRAQYAEEMIDTFRWDFATRIGRAGRWHALRFAVAAWLDAVRAGLGERQYRRHGGHTPQRRREFGIGVSWLDVKLGLRMLVKFKGLSIAGGLALAGAIGIGAAWYDVIGDQLHPRLPLPEGDRIVEIEMHNAATRQGERKILHDFLNWRRDVRAVEDLGAYRTRERNLMLGDARPEEVTVAEITASAFRLTRVPPLLGRPLLEADEQPGAPPVVVLGYHVWQRRFGGRADAIGQAVQLGHSKPTVVGVMPQGFAFPVNHKLWVPLQLQASGYAPLEGVAVQVFGRLAPGVSRQQAHAEIAAMTEREAASSPRTHQHLRASVVAYGAVLVLPGQRDSLGGWIGFATTHLPILLVLIVACVNVGTLVYARTATREAEIAVRHALGASRGRIVGQLFVEALVLAAIATMAGLTAADFGLRWVYAFLSGQDQRLPFWIQPGLKFSTVIYAVLLAVAAAALLGVLPALKATGSRVQGQLKNLGAGGSTLRFGGLWTTAMIAQVALTVICIPPAIAISEESLRDRVIRERFPAEQYLAASLELDRDPTVVRDENASGSDYGARLEPLYRELERRVGQEPGVVAVTFGDRLPGISPSVRSAELETPAGAEPIRMRNLWTASVGPGYFEAFEKPIVSGRALNDGDRTASPQRVLVNEAFARRWLKGGNPVGRRVRYTSADRPAKDAWLEIVGMVRDIGMTPTNFGEAPYVFTAASPASVNPLVMAVRTTGDPATLVPRVRAIAAGLDAGLRLDTAQPLEDLVWSEDVPILAISGGVVAVVVLGLCLSAAGIFALMSVSVARRTREIGLRAALGATRARLLAGIFSRAFVLVGSGVAAGNAGLFALGLIGVDRVASTGALITTSTVMVIVGLLACVEPARRALRIQPTEALKEA